MTQTQVIWHPSPNCGPRPDGLTPCFVMLHYTAMDSAQAALERLCDPVAAVSSHYLIGRDGTCWQMVKEGMRAWHAGDGSWHGVVDMNSRSVGIEIDNRGVEPFAEPQMAVLERLLSDIMARWSIRPEAVIGHSDFAPGRKSDPGVRFDWARLARQGLAATTPYPVQPDQPREQALAAAGYTYDRDAATRFDAFLLRHGAWARDRDGVLAALAQSAHPSG